MPSLPEDNIQWLPGYLSSPPTDNVIFPAHEAVTVFVFFTIFDKMLPGYRVTKEQDIN